MNRRRGQGLVEFALVMPILLFMIMGIFDFSRLFTTYAVTSNSLRTALRLAEVRGLDANNPQYANCGAMRGITSNVLFANAPTVTIFYRKASSPGTTYTCATGVNQYTPLSNIETGDMLNIRLQTNVRFITPIISNLWPVIPLDLSGQRTIVQQVQLGSVAGSVADSDYDGLNDAWEMSHFGNLNQSGTDDPDGDGCNNGCEETRNTNPNNPDTDGDGISDGDEIECGLDPNDPGSSADNDGDGLSAFIECALGLDDSIPDYDGDGLSDGYEYSTSNTNPTLADSDGDGLSDGAEVNIHHTNPLAKDSDGDGLYDNAEISRGTNPTNIDSDNDGLLDGEEVGYSDGSFPGWGTNPLNWDTDGDGLGDGYELVINDLDPRTRDADDTDPTKWDTDGDGLSDGQEHLTFLTNPNDPDSDNDNLLDGEEITPTLVNPTCGFILGPTDPLNPDTDGDGIQDDIDCTNANDSDGDGLLDSWEITYFATITLYNGTDDPDADGCNNACELTRNLNPMHPDTDDDGLTDGQEALSSVPGYTGTNPLNPDTDGDGVLDGDEIANGINPFDDDTDGDGLFDGQELLVLNHPKGLYTTGLGTNPASPDSDNDGLTDYQEMTINDTDPMVRDADDTDPRDSDTDDDGLNDGMEVNIWFTDPHLPDTDGDTLLDGHELTNGDTEPGIMDANDTDPTKWDTDGDGLSDADEFLVYFTNPRLADSDGDGLDDEREIHFGSPILPDTPYTVTAVITTPDRAGSTVVTTVTQNLDPNVTDTDGDGASDGDEVLLMHTNPRDIDTDGDGLDDSDERVNGTDPLHWDSDRDKWGDLEELNFGSSNYSVTVSREIGGLATYTVTNNLNPRLADSDGDGLNDWVETHFAAQNYSVTVNGSTTTPVTDNLDPTSRDTDLDGVNDGPEVTNLTNPLHWDTDGDVFGDGVDNPYPLNWPVIAVTCQDPTNCTRPEQSNTGTNSNRYITYRITATYVSTSQNVQASYATANTGSGAGHAIGKAGTCALDSGDYLNNTGTANFNAVGNQDIQVRICRQENSEPDETFNFTIAAAGPNQAVTLVTAPATRTGTITNRNNPTLTVTCPNNPGCTIPSLTTGSTPLVFRVSAADLDTASISVTPNVAGVTATLGGNCSGADFRRSTGWVSPITVNNNAYTDVTVTICTRGNNADSGDETFTFTTAATANDLYLPGNVTATIDN